MMRPAAYARTARARSSGFTLMELLISLAVLGMLFASVCAAMVLCARTLGGNVGQAKLSDGANATQQILNDVRCATSFTERTDTALTFTVADRDADGMPETIRYAWSGVPGDALTRSYNKGPAMPFASDVRSLKLSYLCQVQTSTTAAPVEGAEIVLCSHDDSGGGKFVDYQLDKDSWCAESFKPTLPANAISWRITRVKIMAKQAGAPNENLVAEIRPVDASNKPTGSPLQSMGIAEALLPSSYAWIDISLGNISGLDPADTFCLEIRQTSSNANAAKLQREDSVSASTDAFTSTGNAGSSWTIPDSNKHLRFYIYGTVTTVE